MLAARAPEGPVSGCTSSDRRAGATIIPHLRVEQGNASKTPTAAFTQVRAAVSVHGGQAGRLRPARLAATPAVSTMSSCATGAAPRGSRQLNHTVDAGRSTQDAGPDAPPHAPSAHLTPAPGEEQLYLDVVRQEICVRYGRAGNLPLPWNARMKRGPFCVEEIQDAATVCGSCLVD